MHGPQEQYSVIYGGAVVHFQISNIHIYELHYNTVQFMKILHTPLR